MDEHSNEGTRDTNKSNHGMDAAAFFPRTFFGGEAFFSFCAASSAEVRPRAAALRSGRYPLFATEATTPNERRPPERLRTFAVDRAGRTACGDAFDFRVVICSPDSEL